MSELNFEQKVIAIQSELKAPKNQYNSFGKYRYRNQEDILEAVKPLLKKYELSITLTDSINETPSGICYVEARAILHGTDGKWKVEMCLSDLQHPQTLFDLDCSCIPLMSASDSHVVVGVYEELETGDDSYSYIIYDIITKQTKTTQVTEPFIPYFLPDGHLLACIGDKLKKYKIEDGELLPLWTCDGLVNLLDVCADSQGIIYGITDRSSKLIYIISPTGRCVFN